MGVNSAGLRPKLFTFKKVLNELKPSAFFLQETKFKEAGKLKLDNYVIFEKVRNNRDGGGLAFGCIPELSPVWVREGEEDLVEALSVNILVKKDVAWPTGVRKQIPVIKKKHFGIIWKRK